MGDYHILYSRFRVYITRIVYEFASELLTVRIYLHTETILEDTREQISILLC